MEFSEGWQVDGGCELEVGRSWDDQTAHCTLLSGTESVVREATYIVQCRAIQQPAATAIASIHTYYI